MSERDTLRAHAEQLVARFIVMIGHRTSAAAVQQERARLRAELAKIRVRKDGLKTDVVNLGDVKRLLEDHEPI